MQRSEEISNTVPRILHSRTPGVSKIPGPSMSE